MGRGLLSPVCPGANNNIVASLEARIHGYTGWINMRLAPFNRSLSNVLMDLLRGTNMKYLLESYTGKDNDKFESLEKY